MVRALDLGMDSASTIRNPSYPPDLRQRPSVVDKAVDGPPKDEPLVDPPSVESPLANASDSIVEVERRARVASAVMLAAGFFVLAAILAAVFALLR